MANFNLEDYDPVEERIAKFYKDHPDGRIITSLEHYETDTVVFKAELYKTPECEKPWTTGFAEEVRGSGFVNKTSHVENCETSAIGRALANAIYAGNKRPSREEMEKVARGSSNGPQEQIRTGEISPKQLAAILKMEAYNRGSLPTEEGKKIAKEIVEHWTKEDASNYIGKKMTLDEIRSQY